MMHDARSMIHVQKLGGSAIDTCILYLASCIQKIMPGIPKIK
jgi:hypothetical protein